jgi:hypothetical protein
MTGCKKRFEGCRDLLQVSIRKLAIIGIRLARPQFTD